MSYILKSNNNVEGLFFGALLLLVFVLSFTKDMLTGFPFYEDISVRYIDDLVVCTFFTYAVSVCCIRLRIPRKLVLAFLFLGVFLVYVLLQWIFLNVNMSFLNFIYGFRDSYWYLGILMACIAYMNNDPRRMGEIEHLIIMMLKAFVIVEISAVILQEIAFIIMRGQILYEDAVTGTLGKGQSHILAYSLLLCFPVIWLYMRRARAWILAGCFTVVLIASARAAVVIATIAWLTSIMVYKKAKYKGLIGNISKKYAFAVLFIMVSGIALYNAVAPGAAIRVNLMLQQQMRNVSESDENKGSRRVGVFLYSEALLSQYGNIWGGAGAANYASRSAPYIDKGLYKIFSDIFPFKNEMLSGGSSLNVWFIEYGIVGGVLLFLIPYSFLIRYLYKTGPPYFMAGLVFFLGLIANKLSEAYATAIIFWLIVILAYIQNHKTYMRVTSRKLLVEPTRQ